MDKKRLKIAFIHPDLGIGGAEQLIINLAIALKNEGHFVKLYTPHHDRNHCFPETKDGTLEVEVKGNFIPAKIFGRFTALCAYIRMILCTLSVIFYGGQYDVVIVDQVTHCLPLLRLTGRRTIFYCHYPDKLLCVERKSIVKKIYRFFLDTTEELCLFFANMVLVNSNFTKEVVQRAFPLYSRLRSSPNTLYPAIDFEKFDQLPQLQLAHQDSRLQKNSFFISLNRYERKKNISLAIHSFALFRQKLEKEDVDCHNVKLVVAGGYEARIQENKEHLLELQETAQRQGVGEFVSFKRNITDEERSWYLQNCVGVLYTPEREHFGIVPIEAMYNEAPVIACNSGGPKESIIDGQTGFLCDSQVDQWSDKMIEIFKNEKNSSQLGKNGRKRVVEMFSFASFQAQINNYVNMVCQRKTKSS